jgi:hypothetical protein
MNRISTRTNRFALLSVLLSLGIIPSLCAGETGTEQPKPAVQATTCPAADTQPAVRLVVTGTIKNFDEFKAAVVPETYIQLVPMSATGSFQTLYGDTGVISYYSNLPKMPVPKDAAFSFHLSNLPPGRYFIGAQRLKSATYGRIPNAFLIDEQHVFILVVDAGDQSPRTIAAGDLIVWTH